MPNHAGLVAYRKARSTGTHVGLYRNSEVGFEVEPGANWATVCEDHGGVVFHPTRTAGQTFLSHPEDWCPVCQEAEPRG